MSVDNTLARVFATWLQEEAENDLNYLRWLNGESGMALEALPGVYLVNREDGSLVVARAKKTAR